MPPSTDHAIEQHRSGFSRIKLFFALSRTPHGILDMTTPMLGALIALGAFPPPGVIFLGLITAFAGYTAVYALNDVVDYHNDRKKFADGCLTDDSCSDLDAVWVRHPMAQGLLSLREGIVWAAAWAVVAGFGAYLLNPVCAAIFLAGCALETIYCILWRVSPLRTVVSGCVKTLGAVAAVFAVMPAPSPPVLMVMFICLFLWEIGGQNIPNDWTDAADDRMAGGRTVPVCFGTGAAVFIIVLGLSLAVSLSALLFLIAPGGYGLYALLAVIAIGIYLLLVPAVRLYRTPGSAHAMDLFNRASYYPSALLGVVLVHMIV